MLSTIILLIALCVYTTSNVLSSVNFIQQFIDTGIQIPFNYVGLSINYSQVNTGILNASLFQQYIANSKVYGTINTPWVISIKNQLPKGYKVNCSSYSSWTANYSCVFNITTTAISQLGTFMKNSNSTTGVNSFAFDVEGSDFNNTSFLSYFSALSSALKNASSVVGGASLNLQFDLADKYGEYNIKQNYTPTQFISDYQNAYFNSLYYIDGPGITEDADPSWINSFNALSGNHYGKFTVRCVHFKNDSMLTVQNILNQANYRTYIYNRFTTQSGVINPTSGKLVITQIKMANGLGIDGITNGFVAALWALDMALQFALFGGKGINFLADFATNSKQGIFGPSPTFTPSPIYYSLLMMSMIQYSNPTFVMPKIYAGSSDKIKAYGLLSGLQFSIVIINKDTNPNASGYVAINMISTDTLQCLYLTGGSLTATSGATFMGHSFVGGNSTPQGNYTALRFGNVNGSFMVKLSYAEAAMCYTLSPMKSFPKVYKYQSIMQFGAILTFAFMIFISL